jgi:hypothetical protein
MRCRRSMPNSVDREEVGNETQAPPVNDIFPLPKDPGSWFLCIQYVSQSSASVVRVIFVVFLLFNFSRITSSETVRKLLVRSRMVSMVQISAVMVTSQIRGL